MLRRYWGGDDFHLGCYHSNCPCPGQTDYQEWCANPLPAPSFPPCAST